MRKWILAIIVLLMAVVLAAFMLNATGVIDLRPMVVQRMETIPALAPYLETYHAGLAVEKEIEDALAALEIEKGELVQSELELAARTEALAAREKQLARQKSEVDHETEQLLKLRQEIEAARAGFLELERLRSIYAEMKGKDAAAIMSQLRPEMIAFILAEMDPEIAGDILTNLEPKLAAEITRMALTNKK